LGRRNNSPARSTVRLPKAKLATSALGETNPRSPSSQLGVSLTHNRGRITG